MRLASGIKQQNGTYRFDLAAVGMVASVVIASKVAEKKDANAPDWYLYHCGERCGALWTTTPKNGGDNYLEGNLESPVFPGGKTRVAVFKAKDEKRKGELDMAWTPPRESGRVDPAPSAPTSSGYASGSAPAPAPAGGDDDDIPF